MKNFALIDSNNVVLNISVANDTWECDGWIEYNNTNPAYIDGQYVEGYFYTIQPFNSWTRINGLWVAPVAMPNDGKEYDWDEPTLSWIDSTIL